MAIFQRGGCDETMPGALGNVSGYTTHGCAAGKILGYQMSSEESEVFWLKSCGNTFSLHPSVMAEVYLSPSV